MELPREILSEWQKYGCGHWIRCATGNQWHEGEKVIPPALFAANQTDQEMYITYSRNSNDYGPGEKIG